MLRLKKCPLCGVNCRSSRFNTQMIGRVADMNTTVGKLLTDIKLRLEMQQEGITNPAIQVKEATQRLVDKLSELDSAEEIRVICGDGSLVSYVRHLTGEVLAEIYQS